MFDIKETGDFVEGLIRSNPLFQYYRIVDIHTYMVHSWKEGKACPMGFRCYEVWKRGGACQNCISSLAVEEKRPIIKLETMEDKIFLIEALPLPELGPDLALELIREVTDNLLVNDHYSQENLALSEMIQKMNELAIRDSYTGLYNKRFLEHELHRQILEWIPSNPLVIALIDIDHFKDVNDTYGHLMGDQVILAFAEELKACAEQNSGWAGRVGGDEFLLAFQGVSLGEINPVIETFSRRISDMEFRDSTQDCRISISTGVMEYHPEIGDWRELFRQADQKMYLSKQQRLL